MPTIASAALSLKNARKPTSGITSMAHAFALPNPALRIIILIIMIASANAALT